MPAHTEAMESVDSAAIENTFISFRCMGVCGHTWSLFKACVCSPRGGGDRLQEFRRIASAKKTPEHVPRKTGEACVCSPRGGGDRLQEFRRIASAKKTPEHVPRKTGDSTRVAFRLARIHR